MQIQFCTSLKDTKAYVEKELNKEVSREDFNSSLEYASRKARLNRKDASYAKILIPDTIIQGAVMDFVTELSSLLMH